MIRIIHYLKSFYISLNSLYIRSVTQWVSWNVYKYNNNIIHTYMVVFTSKYVYTYMYVCEYVLSLYT